MLEIEHVLLYEGLLDLFIGPVDEESIIEISTLRQASREIDGVLQIGPSPVCLKQDTQFLCPP